MSRRSSRRLVREGDFVAEVDVELVEGEEAWTPYMSLEDAYKTLIESVPAGGFVITTVFGSYDGRHAFPAVMSKHVDVLGPLPQQYYGSCVVSE